MCFGPGAHPPIDPAGQIAGGAISHRSFVMTSADGTPVRAFEALAGDGPSPAAMLVLPDARGLHPFYEELALRFAETGIDALAIDYFARTAGTGDRSDDFAYREHLVQTRWETLSMDITAGAALLDAARPGRSLFAIGFCYGGRLAFLTATLDRPSFAGVVGFYGLPVGPHRIGDTPAPVDLVDRMHGAVLGLFGGADQSIPPDSIEIFDRALTEGGIDHELHVYPGAPHSFFDRTFEEHAAASADAWQRIRSFVASHSA